MLNTDDFSEDLTGEYGYCEVGRKMKALRKAEAWLKQLKNDVERESVSRVRSAPHCCSKPVESTTQEKN